jgi:hypothetical protein
MRLTYDELIFSASANSSMVPYAPVSSSLRQRKARARALTIALSTRGRSDEAGVPAETTTNFRPPHLRTERAPALREPGRTVKLAHTEGSCTPLIVDDCRKVSSASTLGAML